MRCILRLVIASVPLLGCKPELPSLDYRGERVMVGSDEVEQVCGGTLARIDREVEQIEARLDLPIQDSRIDVYIVDQGTVDGFCPGAHNCTLFPSERTPFVVVDHLLFERAIAHELIHARLAEVTSVPLFDEGIAVAASPPRCPRTAPDVELSEILAAKTSTEWQDKVGTYYVGGELVAWLLGEFGAGEVLDFMRAADEGSSPSATEGVYLKHFGRALSSDILAHLRSQADLDMLEPEDFGCLTEPIDSSRGSVQLIADLDCDSGRVHNNFGINQGGYVEWTLRLDHAQTLKLAGDVPFGTSLTIEACGCIPKRGDGDDEYLLSRSVGAYETLQPGSYRLRWIGGLDAGLSLDVELVPLEG